MLLREKIENHFSTLLPKTSCDPARYVWSRVRIRIWQPVFLPLYSRVFVEVGAK